MREGSELAVLVRRRRLELRLTQRQAAERSGVSLATWQTVERRTTARGAFQELTLARVAHGLGLELADVLAVAGAALAAPPPGGAGVTAVDPAVTGDAAAEQGFDPVELVDELGAMLLQLAATSEASFMLVYGQALDATDHFLHVLER